MSNLAKPIGSIDLSKFRLLKNDLFPVYESQRGEKIVNLRDVHAALQVRKKFADWADEKMEEHAFTEGTDYAKKHLQGKIKKAGRQRVEYILPLKVAKKVAMGVNTKDAEFVKDYFLICEEVAVSITAALEPQPLNLLDFTNERVQVQCVRRVATYLMPTTNPALAIDHFRETCKLLTGQRPSAYRKAFVQAGNRVKSLSGRQLMRRFEPAKACAAAFLDDARQRGRDVAQLAQAGVVDAITPAFDALLKAGYTMQELGA
ncbi:antA/AntB antirepressor family protein [Hymenobacter tenuis]